MVDPTGLSGGGGYAVNMPQGPQGPQSIFSDPSAGFGRMGDAFAALPTDPMFMTSLGLLTNDGRLSPGMAYNALAMRQRQDQQALTKEEQRRYEREMKKMEDAQRKMQGLLSKTLGGAQLPATVAPAAPGAAGGFADQATLGRAAAMTLDPAASVKRMMPHLLGGHMFPNGGGPLAGALPPAGGGGAAGPAGGGAPPSLPFAQRGGLLPFDGAPVGSGAPAGAPPSAPRLDINSPEFAAQAIPALMQGSKSDRASALNMLQGLMSRKPGERRILEDATGRKRYADTGEYVFDLPEAGPQPARPFNVAKPTEWQAGVNAMWERDISELGLDPMQVTQADATAYGADLFEARADALRALQGPDLTKFVRGDLLGPTGQARMNELADKYARRQAGSRLHSRVRSRGGGSRSGDGLPGITLYKQGPEAEQRIKISAPAVFDAVTGMAQMEAQGQESTVVIDAMGNDGLMGYVARNAPLVSDDSDKLFANHKKQYVDNMTRIMTGAALKNEELLAEAARNVPEANDPPQLKAVKNYKRVRLAIQTFDSVLDSKTYSDRDGIEAMRAMAERLRREELPAAIKRAQSYGYEPATYEKRVRDIGARTQSLGGGAKLPSAREARRMSDAELKASLGLD